MSYEVLEKKIEALPAQCIMELENYVDFLFQKYSMNNNTEPLKEKNRFNRKAGMAKDSNFYMAPDFDEPLEDFKDYM